MEGFRVWARIEHGNPGRDGLAVVDRARPGATEVDVVLLAPAPAGWLSGGGWLTSRKLGTFDGLPAGRSGRRRERRGGRPAAAMRRPVCRAARCSFQLRGRGRYRCAVTSASGSEAAHAAPLGDPSRGEFALDRFEVGDRRLLVAGRWGHWAAVHAPRAAGGRAAPPDRAARPQPWSAEEGVQWLAAFPDHGYLGTSRLQVAPDEQLRGSL